MNPDFRDMLSALSAARVEFLVVGAYALAVHGVPRATGDIDLWVRPTRENAERTLEALRGFGAPLTGLTAEDLCRPGTVYQIGVAPRRIDLLTAIDGVGFDEAWSSRTPVEIAGLHVDVIGRAALLKNKRATGRPRDIADADRSRSTIRSAEIYLSLTMKGSAADVDAAPPVDHERLERCEEGAAADAGPEGRPLRSVRAHGASRGGAVREGERAAAENHLARPAGCDGDRLDRLLGAQAER